MKLSLLEEEAFMATVVFAELTQCPPISETLSQRKDRIKKEFLIKKFARLIRKRARLRKSLYPNERREFFLVKQRIYANNLYRTSPNRRIGTILRGRLNDLIRQRKYKRTSGMIKYLGCTLQELVVHLEQQFDTGMSWENHGVYGWHIDHIKPLMAFDLLKESEKHIALHYTNLQPLWAEQNIAKRAYDFKFANERQSMKTV